ncbi:MAG: Grx4 family monothiol glutaredoxin [Solirubrobacteraceae bacterium]
MTDEASIPTTPMREAIQSAISENPVILFMKGTPEQPACGFSARTVAMLQSLSPPFAAVDILPDPRIRQELASLSNWPTIPQLFVDGDLVGGCDIVSEMYQSGELQEVLGVEEHSSGQEPAQAGAAPAEAGAAPAEAAPTATQAAPQAPQTPPLSIENRL